MLIAEMMEGFDCNPASVWQCLSTASSLSSWDGLLGTAENSNVTPFTKGQVVALAPSSSRVSSEIHIVSLDKFKSMAYEMRIPKGNLRVTHDIEMQDAIGKPSCNVTRKIEFLPNEDDPVSLTGNEIIYYSSGFRQSVGNLMNKAVGFENPNTVNLEASVETTASPEKIWQVWNNVTHWKLWNPQLTGSALENKELQTGMRNFNEFEQPFTIHTAEVNVGFHDYSETSIGIIFRSYFTTSLSGGQQRVTHRFTFVPRSDCHREPTMVDNVAQSVLNVVDLANINRDAVLNERAP